MRVPLAWATALAFLGGLALGAALLSDAAPLDLGGAREVPVAVRVTNVGTHDANVTLRVDETTRAATGSAQLHLPAGAAAERSILAARGPVVLTVVADWTGAGLDAGRGDVRVQGDPSGCARGEELVFTIEVQTSRGVSFPRRDAACA